MSQYLFTLVDGFDEETGETVEHISVFVSPTAGFQGTDSRSPAFQAIKDIVLGNAPSVEPDEMEEMFSTAKAVENAVANANLSSRVKVENGEVLLDGVALSNALTDHILKLMAEQSGDLTGWVRFLERIEANPNDHSREALFTWLDALGEFDGGITIDSATGFLVGYKGVRRDENGNLFSVRSGPAIVDGVEHTDGPVPNAVGSVIEMPRDEVQHDPSIGCSRGLHVGTWSYAKSWNQGAMLEVHVDPADVVSVPTQCGAQKMRCAKYLVVGVIEQPYTTATLPSVGEDFDEDHDDFIDDDPYSDDFGW
jgi:hypothetical protein